MWVPVMPVDVGALGNGSQRIATVENRRKNRGHLDGRIIEIGKNTEKSPGGVRGFAVSQTPV